MAAVYVLDKELLCWFPAALGGTQAKAVAYNDWYSPYFASFAAVAPQDGRARVDC